MSFLCYSCLAAESRAQALSGQLRNEMQKLRERAAVAINKEKKEAEAYKDQCLEAYKKVRIRLIDILDRVV